MAINWEELENELGGFKDWAPAGVYKVKVAGLDIHEVGQNGSIAQDFTFEEDNYKYPKATHWLSFKNDGWRQLHNKNLMVVLGASEDNAKKAVETCESKGDKDAIVKAYKQAYDRLVQKHPVVEIECWQEGKYGRSDFTAGSVRMSRPEDVRDDSVDDIMSSAEEVKEEADFPF